MFAQFKRESLRKLRMAEDKSPKGSIDAPIVDLIRLINDHPNYVRVCACVTDAEERAPLLTSPICSLRTGHEQLVFGTHRSVLWRASSGQHWNRQRRDGGRVCEQPDHQGWQVAAGGARDHHGRAAAECITLA